MLKAYKYRIYPNSEQRLQIAKTFGCCRFVYNQTLAYRKEVYKKGKKSVSKTDCNNYCNRQLKKEYEWLKEMDKFALTNAIYNMDAAYQKFLMSSSFIFCQPIPLVFLHLSVIQRRLISPWFPCR